MEQDIKKSSMLKQEIEQMMLNLIPVTSNNKFAVGQQSRVIEDTVCGMVQLAAAPHYSLTLDTGTAEQPFILPLTLADSARHLCQWIAVVGKQIQIHQLLVICEQFQIFEKKQKLQYVSLVVKWEDIRILENIDVTKQEVVPSDRQANPLLFNSTKLDMKSNADLNLSRSTCRIMIHHVSMPFYIDQLFAYCLVYISYSSSKQVEVKLWLVFRAEQVAWREFLVPNREYLIEFPVGVGQYYFDKFCKPLNRYFPQPSREFDAIFHHKAIFPTLNACVLPFGCNIYLTSNTQFSNFVQRFVKDPFSLWYSANEANNASVELSTFYGQVESIIYDEEFFFKSCYLCIRAKPKKPTVSEPQLSVTHPWMNPWTSQLSIDEGKILELPCAEDGNSTMKTGVPGNKVQLIKLRDVITGNEQNVYIKHSCTPQSQQLFRLTAGMVVCITHLNRRCSSSGNYYFIATILSNFRILSYSNNGSPSEGWGLYGLRHLIPDSKDKMWGVLELFNLYKVAIRAKCTNCKAIFFKGMCTKECSAMNNYTMSAYAICWLQIINNEKTASLEKVLIKDNFVQKLLCIPEDIWQTCAEAASEKEIVCLMNDQDMSGQHFSPDLKELLKMYCNIPRPKGKFYISVRKISSFSDEDPFYYCIHLESINRQRLNIVAKLANSVLSR